MAKREILYRGKFHTVELAITANGRCPGKKFLDSLSKVDREKILRIIKRLADEGRVTNREKFKKLKVRNFLSSRTPKSECPVISLRMAG